MLVRQTLGRKAGQPIFFHSGARALTEVLPWDTATAAIRRRVSGRVARGFGIRCRAPVPTSVRRRTTNAGRPGLPKRWLCLRCTADWRAAPILVGPPRNPAGAAAPRAVFGSQSAHSTHLRRLAEWLAGRRLTPVAAAIRPALNSRGARRQ